MIHISHYNSLRIKLVLFIALFWTAIDLAITLLNGRDEPFTHALWHRELFIFIVSLIIGYLFVYKPKRTFAHLPLWLKFLLRSSIMVALALITIFILQFFSAIVFEGESVVRAWNILVDYAIHKQWLLHKIVYWVSIFFVTQLILTINEKFSPGETLDIITGKYTRPRIERRIVMFIDLRDSTPIAERMGHEQYFRFISEFIYQVSRAVIECEGSIYQYVGDEIVCSWRSSAANAQKCLTTIIQAERNIQRRGEKFKKRIW